MTRDLAKAIAARRDQIRTLQAEIDALDIAEKIIMPTRSVKKGSAAKAGVRKKRRKMSQAEKKVVSERMRAYWAKKRKKSSRKS